MDDILMMFLFDLLAMAPIFNVPIMDPVFVYEQSSMEVGCDILGGPLPTITWLKGNTLVCHNIKKKKCLQ